MTGRCPTMRFRFKRGAMRVQKFRLILAFPNVGVDKILEEIRDVEYLPEKEFRCSMLFPTNYISEIRKILDSNTCRALIVDGSITLIKYLDAEDLKYAIVCRESNLVDVDTIFQIFGERDNIVLRYYIDEDDVGLSAVVKLAGS